MTSEIVRQVKEAYTVILPGLPYPELPVISVSGKAALAILRTIHALIFFGQLREVEALFYRTLPPNSKIYSTKMRETVRVLSSCIFIPAIVQISRLL